MLAIVYLILSMTVGYVLCSFFLPDLTKYLEKTAEGATLKLSRFFILVPAWYTVGTIFNTWVTYISAYIFKNAEQPLIMGNVISLSFAFLLSAAGIFVMIRTRQQFRLLTKVRRFTASEAVFMALVVLLTFILMYGTFFVKEDRLYVGVSVFSDFAPHIGVIRSFSHGNNFPSTYPHYAGIDIRYHFMFQFMVGNLEFLGLRLDHAFNIPSMLSYIFSYCLLYALALRITGKRLTGFITCLLFAFRSSPSLFTYMVNVPKNTSVIQSLVLNTGFIGYTTHEDWGLWNLNVYCNQRHLANGICVMLLLIHIFLPNLFEMAERIKEAREEHRRRVEERRAEVEAIRLEEYEAKRLEAEENGEEIEPYEPHKEGRLDALLDNFGTFVLTSFFTKDGWLPKRIMMPIAAGLLLGAAAFWNGAAVLATIMILFVFAMVADHRLEYLITAVLAAGLSRLQTGFFAKGVSVVTPKMQYGFISESTTFFGTLDYVLRLCGILIPVLLVAFVFVKGVKKWILIAFAGPFLFSFYVSLTVDVTVNHKYIMLSIMLMNIFAAWLITTLLENRSGFVKALAVGLIVLLTITGVYDLTTILKKNNPNGGCLTYALEDPLVDWITENTTSQDIFLTAHYSLARPVLAGAMLFEGHAYYPLTAGYDTNLRYKLTKQMFECTDRDELLQMIRENCITYVIIDNDARTTGDFSLNEEIFKSTFECVYSEGSSSWEIDIYDTSKLISQ